MQNSLHISTATCMHGERCTGRPVASCSRNRHQHAPGNRCAADRRKCLNTVPHLHQLVCKGHVGAHVGGPEVGVKPAQAGGAQRHQVMQDGPQLLLAELCTSVDGGGRGTMGPRAAGGSAGRPPAAACDTLQSCEQGRCKQTATWRGSHAAPPLAAAASSSVRIAGHSPRLHAQRRGDTQPASSGSRPQKRSSAHSSRRGTCSD